MRLIPVSILFVLTFSTPLVAQTSYLEANRKGLEIVRNALTAHGGVAATDSLKIRFRVLNDRNITPGQSYAADEPFDTYRAEYSFMIDRLRNRETVCRKIPIPGFEFESSQFIVDGKSTLYARETKTYTETPATLLYASLFLPQTTLVNILNAPYAIRYNGMEVRARRPVYAIAAVRGNDLVQVFIDKATGLLSEVIQLVPGFGAAGDGERKIEYTRYIKVGAVQVPQQVNVTTINHVMGTVTNVFSVSDIAHDFDANESGMQVPEGYIKQDFSYRRDVALKQIGKDVYVVEHAAPEAIGAAPGYPFSYNVAFAEFEDHVLVIEAPWDERTTQRMLALIKKTIPAKPVRYLVQTHHHDDHIGGIRGYIAARATILTPPSNAGLINRIAEARLAHPDDLAKSPIKPSIEPVIKRKELTDKRNSVILVDIGPNTHSKENLIAYFPAQKILYQADMINEGEHGWTATSDEFIAGLVELGFDVETIVGTHGKMLAKTEVKKLLTRQQPAGSPMTKLYGDHTKEGLYCFRLKIPAGTQYQPHSHPLDQFVTVLEGKLVIGYGEEFDMSYTETIEAGSFLVIPANKIHYEQFPEPTHVQIHGPGPLKTVSVKVEGK